MMSSVVGYWVKKRGGALALSAGMEDAVDSAELESMCKGGFVPSQMFEVN